MADKNELMNLTVGMAARALREGDISAESYAEALIAQAARAADLNSFIAHDPEAVRAAARRADRHRQSGGALGALHGVPLAIKDNIDTADLPTTAGTPGLRRNRPRRNAALVQRLIDGGAIVFGKNNMHELAYGVTTNNAAFGPARNPYDRNRVPGGSSGGTAAAVAARIVPGGIGTDTGGSVRMPAALCGGVGFRPSTGRWPQDGMILASHTRDTAGPMTRNVADCVLLDGVVTGGAMAVATPMLDGLRLGLPRRPFWEDLDPEIERVLEQALVRLREAGVVLVEASGFPMLDGLDMRVGAAIAGYENIIDTNAYLAGCQFDIDLAGLVAQIASPDVMPILQAVTGSGKVGKADYEAALATGRPRLQAHYQRYFADARVDALLMPTVPLATPRVGQDETVRHNGRDVSVLATMIRNANPGSVAGIPGLSIPAGMTSDGMPVGLELDGPAQSDLRLLAIGQALEAMLPPLPAPTMAL